MIEESGKTSVKNESRFEGDAGRYAAYLETPEGRLRTELAFAHLREFLPAQPGAQRLRALDLGCGTGAAGIGLARMGMQVTLLDASPAMLELAERNADAAWVGEKIALQQGDAAQVERLFGAGAFDVVVCHNVLEFVEEPGEVLRNVARVMRDARAILSVVARNQAGEAMKAALQAGDLAAAERSLHAESARDTLYGGNVRLFTAESLEALLKGAGMAIQTRRGVRVVADYLPAQISRAAEYERIFALERKLGERREFFWVARYLQYLAGGAAAGAKGER